VEFYWNALCKNTICAEANLHFDVIPAKIHCEDCVNDYELDHDLIPCPACSSMNIKICGGDEFILKSIEVEK
jgi:hydrogenase nickel incorporation protein HypA/HybF